MDLDIFVPLLICLALLVYGMRGPSGKAPDDDQGSTPRDLERDE